MSEDLKSFKNNLILGYWGYSKNNNCHLQDVAKLLNEDYGKYGEFGFTICSGGDEPEAQHICKIDELNIFDSDSDAAKFAKKYCNLKLIPQKEIVKNGYFEFWRYLDTPENRKILKKAGGLKK